MTVLGLGSSLLVIIIVIIIIIIEQVRNVQEYHITGNWCDRKHSQISRFVGHSRIFSSKTFPFHAQRMTVSSTLHIATAYRSSELSNSLLQVKSSSPKLCTTIKRLLK